jgi:hypothetical protein
MPIRITKQQSAPNLEPGTYRLQLANVREVQVSDPDNLGEMADRIELTFSIADHPRLSGKVFSDLATPLLGPRSKLGQVIRALNGGVELPDGEIDLETFVGRSMQATIRRKDSGYNSVIPETALPLDLNHPQES